jgi:hypothetical protein
VQVALESVAKGGTVVVAELVEHGVDSTAQLGEIANGHGNVLEKNCSCSTEEHASRHCDGNGRILQNVLMGKKPCTNIFYVRFDMMIYDNSK